MSWQDEDKLTKGQDNQIPIRIIPPKNGNGIVYQQSTVKKNPQTIRMPIPQFDIDHMSQSQYDGSDELKISLGVPKENSFLMNSQTSSLPFKQSYISIQTQTDDFTFLEDLFSEPKIYEIPIQLEVEEYPQIQQKQIQVSQSFIRQFLQKIQQTDSAVRRQINLRMNSGIVSLNVESFSFSKFDRGDTMQQSNIYRVQSKREKPVFEEEEQLLLDLCPQTNSKQNLYQTGNFQMNFTTNEFQNVYPQQKSRISGSSSSPDNQNLIMRTNQKQIDMMNTKNIQRQKIDEQYYQDLQNRCYMLQEENIQKAKEIQALNKKIEQLGKQIEEIEGMRKKEERFMEDIEGFKQEIQKKSMQIVALQQTNIFFQKKLKNYQQIIHKKQQEIQQVLLTKQKQMRQLQVQIKDYREQLDSGEQKLLKQNQTLLKYLQQKQQQINQLKLEYENKYELYLIEIKSMEDKINKHENTIEKMEGMVQQRDAVILEIKEENKKIKEEFNILLKKFKENYQMDNQEEDIKKVYHKSMKNIKSGNYSQLLDKQSDLEFDFKSEPEIKQKKPSLRNNKSYNNLQQTNKNVKFSDSFEKKNKQLKLKDENQNREVQFTSNRPKSTIQNNYHINESNIVHEEQQSYNRTSMSNTQELEQQEGRIFLNGDQNQFENRKQYYHEHSNIQNSNINPSNHQQSKIMNYSFQKRPNSIMHQRDQGEFFQTNKSNVSQNSTSNHYKKLYRSSDHKPSQQDQQTYYPEQLQKFILIYQAIIQKQLSTIQQLQQKVLQFLKDALTKQTQAQLLYSQLCQYQNSINTLKIQKYDFQLQNQRLKKMITDSENKLSVLGNRLIKLAKNNSSNSKIIEVKENQILGGSGEEMILEEQVNR